MIFVCSPYRGNEKKNIEFAKQCCKKVCELNQIPFAPHLYFTQFLDDSIGLERKQGMKYGLEFMKICDEVWVFGNTISSGMKEEIEYANSIGKKVYFYGN